jgi:hypothetical protein
MTPKPSLVAYLIPALACLLLAGLLRLWVGPLTGRLPADFSTIWEYTAEDSFRETPVDAWSKTIVTARMTTQTLSLSGTVAIIQQDLYWYTQAGDLIFTSTGLYGVDRSTRRNMPDFGDVDRSGQFLFPPHLAKTGFTYWNSMYIGPRQATFVSMEVLDGLPVYKFHFTGTDMDETAGYANLGLVPEKYIVHTDCEGDLWIEPLTGTLLDVQESGVSYFVDPVSGKHVAEFHLWSDTFSPATRQAQLQLARRERLLSPVIEGYLPALLLLSGLAWLLVGWVRRNSSKIRSTPSLNG